MHSDDFEKAQVNTNKILAANPIGMGILYWCPASRDQNKPLLVQPQISYSANGLAVANPTVLAGVMIYRDMGI